MRHPGPTIAILLWCGISLYGQVAFRFDADTGTGARHEGALTTPSAAVPGNADEVAALLAQPLPERTEVDAYLDRCKDVLGEHPGTPLKTALYQRMGDICWSLGRFSEMEQWYRKAISLDSSLEKSTTMGYRLRLQNRVTMKTKAVAASAFMVIFVFAMLIVRAARNRRDFDAGFFLKRFGIFLALYCVLAAAVFFLDAPIAARRLLNMSDVQALDLSINKPVFPLSVFDPGNLRIALWILFCGFFPILYALLYASFRKPHSRLLLCGLSLAATAALWTHFYFENVYNGPEIRKAWVLGGRIYLRDEPEDLLVKSPQKALRANPGLLQSKNDDLQKFLHKHFPNGFPGGGR